MKKKVLLEKTFCDVCSKEAIGYLCILCGKEFCYKCRETFAVYYKQGVYFSGRDGLYCLKCDKTALESGDKLHTAYRKIRALRDEAERFYADFEKRAKDAEEDVARLSKKGANP